MSYATSNGDGLSRGDLTTRRHSASFGVGWEKPGGASLDLERQMVVDGVVQREREREWQPWSREN